MYQHQYMVTDPICIKIVDPSATMTSDQLFGYTYYYRNVMWNDVKTNIVSGNVKVNTRLCFVGDTITFNATSATNNRYTVIESGANTANGVGKNADTISTATYSKVDYQFYYYSGSSSSAGTLQDARSNFRVYAMMDIKVLPASAKNAKLTLGNTTASIYESRAYTKDIVLTQEDIDRGCVVIDYSITGYAANTKLAFMTGNSTLTKKS